MGACLEQVSWKHYYQSLILKDNLPAKKREKKLSMQIEQRAKTSFIVFLYFGGGHVRSSSVLLKYEMKGWRWQEVRIGRQVRVRIFEILIHRAEIIRLSLGGNGELWKCLNRGSDVINSAF